MVWASLAVAALVGVYAAGFYRGLFWAEVNLHGAGGGDEPT